MNYRLLYIGIELFVFIYIYFLYYEYHDIYTHLCIINMLKVDGILFSCGFIFRYFQISRKNPFYDDTSSYRIIYYMIIICFCYTFNIVLWFLYPVIINVIYLIFIFPAAHFFTVVRSIRLIRVFRVFKLSHYLRGAHTMQIALRSSRPKIVVFLLSVMILVIVLGTLMYIIEGSSGTIGFNNIPNSIYWAVVTLTTVGYGTVTPITVFGKIVASFIMILGYGIIAVPTGIVSASIVRKQGRVTTRSCIDCSKDGHEQDAIHCKFCGSSLD